MWSVRQTHPSPMKFKFSGIENDSNKENLLTIESDLTASLPG